MSIKVFRVIILIACLIYIALLVAPMLDPIFLTDEELTVFSYVGYNATLNLSDTALWFLVGLWFLAIFGVYMFFNWGRVLLVFWVCLSSVLIILSGLDIRTGYESFLVNISNILDGLIISIAFFSELSSKYKSF